VHEGEITGKLNGQQKRKLIETLRKQDLDRILAEADALKNASKVN
jgi:hypothetical protein